MIFGALRPAELERMRRETTIFKDNSIQTQVRTKTSGGEVIKVTVRKHNNPRIDAVEALQSWMDFIKTTFKDEHVCHAVIALLARQEGADWKAINAHARWAPGSRVAQEYYSVFPVQDTNWILETIGGPAHQRGEDNKPDKSGESKDRMLEIADADSKDRT
ncbi:uncharacterized protein MONOS_10568 [Monocercomonoides exilis]|uniref:uncharacterized protein n=1 Tax=Monocercomonoides exilis TaxID=2049356 RepID=UPI0035594B06|nr:hypothetical protein MONOS_10568 [Monocercomonoides exilis]|eukprot:MONOS_10568.1-p1 / transcript=MONOS_10568.1 / gene=MONOS_10568 / organism=Monocercomonoides_exilis_PA203 / gene_product=unspecified product / transcript_product=unspecified product / location=Mono_scaffold00485:37298-37891(-) / protein_length=161 / sequence_SO=supercontig / SO=protein_coding / is_pseudo=false